MKYIEEVRLIAPQTPEGWRFIAGVAEQYSNDKSVKFNIKDSSKNIIIEYTKEREVFFYDRT